LITLHDRLACWLASRKATAEYELTDNSDGRGPYISRWVSAVPQPALADLPDDAAVEAWRASSRLASFAPLIPHAALFRATLRKHFGANAETNREVTAGTVADYFTARQIAGTISAAELADAVVLDKLFTELAAWGGTGETWSLPWDQVRP
jgi:hypothetical protein